MVSGKSFTKEFIFSKFTNKSEIIDKSTENSRVVIVGEESRETEQQMTNINLMVRRGSKSLPASPNSMRKFQPNPYFTSTNSNSNSSSSSSSSDTNRSNWFLAGILGYNQRDHQTTSITSIASSTSSPSLAKSTASDDNNLYKSTSNPKILKAKPSELREMNFWSPTSM